MFVLNSLPPSNSVKRFVKVSIRDRQSAYILFLDNVNSKFIYKANTGSVDMCLLYSGLSQLSRLRHTMYIPSQDLIQHV